MLPLDCKLSGVLSATEFVANSAFPALEERLELPIPDSEVTRSSSAAKIASLFEIRDFGCLVSRNMIFSGSVVVKYNTITAKSKHSRAWPAPTVGGGHAADGLIAGMARSCGVAAQPGQAQG